MLTSDIFRSSLKTLKTRKRQTFLTMLGIIIGSLVIGMYLPIFELGKVI